VKLQRQVAVRHPFGTSPERRYLARGAAFLTFWRVVAGALLMMPVAVLIEHTQNFEPRPEDVTKAIVRVFAYEAFPQWATTNHVDACPASLVVLEPYVARDAVDAWDRPLELRCGPGYRGAWVRSAGPDHRFDTADDITSIDAAAAAIVE
jgi:hypothetical protein